MPKCLVTSLTKTTGYRNRKKVLSKEATSIQGRKNKEEQLGFKILVNDGYGLFGSPAFKYADVRVAELITAIGRHALRQMKGIAPSLGLAVVEVDRGSLFFDGNDSDGRAVQYIISLQNARRK